MSKKRPEPKMRANTPLVRFSIKSSFLILGTILLSTLGIPILFDALGFTLNPLRVLLIGLATGGSVSYSLFFLDSKRGLTKGFWLVLVIFGSIASLIAYFWVYNIYYI